MNQDQRKFLIEQVNKTSRNQVEKLEHQVPTRPSLNNYLVAAFLDGTIAFADIDQLREKLRKQVLKFGVDDRLVVEHDKGYGRSRRESDPDLVQVQARDLFIIPDNYLEAFAEWEKKRDEIQKQIENLHATRDTLIMKIQIGSSQALDKLVIQVDSMGDLNLMNSQLAIGSGKVE